MSNDVTRRDFSGATAAGTALLLGQGKAKADGAQPQQLGATPPQGFTPWVAPGRVVRVKKAGSLMPNQIYPKADDAKAMAERVMTELTGKASLVDAMKLFVHPHDKVCVKVNGIALTNMATNKELVLPFLDAMIAGGDPRREHHGARAVPSFLDGHAHPRGQRAARA